MTEALLQVDDLSKRFGGVVASEAITFDVPQGELHAVIGPNGAGKTTLIGQLAGEIDSRFRPHPLRRHATSPRCRPTGAASLGSRARSRSPRCFRISPRSTTWRSPSRRMPAIRSGSGAMHGAKPSCASRRAPRSSASGSAQRADVLVSSLSHGEHRQLEIAMALATSPRMLLLDEPMAGMGPEEIGAHGRDMLRELKRELTILLIEHDMEAVFALADRITVLVYGRIIASGSPDEIRANREVREAYLGEQEAAAWLADPLLELDGVETCYGLSQVLFGMSLTIAPGEMVTLMGRNGMGKTTTVRSIMGLTRRAPAAIRFAGAEIRGLPSYRVAKLGIGLVPEGRQIFPNLSVRENLRGDRREPQRRRRPWTLQTICALFPRLRERARQHGQPAFRRRAANAGDRPGADDQSAASHPRRGDRGPGAADPRGNLAVPDQAQARRPVDPGHRQECRGADSDRRPPLPDRARSGGLDRYVGASSPPRRKLQHRYLGI